MLSKKKQQIIVLVKFSMISDYHNKRSHFIQVYSSVYSISKLQVVSQIPKCKQCNTKQKNRTTRFHHICSSTWHTSLLAMMRILHKLEMPA